MENLKHLYFYKHCNQIFTKMKNEEIQNIKNINCNKTRLEQLYPFCKNISLPEILPAKNLQVAETFKKQGNEFFSKRKSYSAIAMYNQGILNCPQTDENCKRLLTLLIANRSAAFFDLNQYDKALFSIEYLLSIGLYPEDLIYKIWLRKAKCLEKTTVDTDEVISSYNKAKIHLEETKMNQNEKSKKISEIEDALKKLENNNKNENPSITKNKRTNCNAFKQNLISLKQTKDLGRFATASTDIEVGTAILVDEPYSYCVAPTNLLNNCQFCLISTNCFIACENCNTVIFCSRDCKIKSSAFHQHECTILGTLSSTGISLNCLLAMRMVTQKSIEFFTNDIEQYEFIVKQKYECNDYSVIKNLCNHNDKRPQGQFVHYSCMVIFILRFLKLTGYFKNNLHLDKTLTSEELIIGLNLLNYILLLEYNAHEISEVAPSIESDKIKTGTTKIIGGGIYPNLVFFNHSCEPSIIRYNVGTKMVVKTITPIKQGDPIYENYGPIYATENKEDRQNFLMNRYMFICQCKPCIENWPKLETMNNEEFKVHCNNKNCKNYVTVRKDITNFEFQCPQCNTPNKFMGVLMKLMEADKIIKKGETAFDEMNYIEASEYFFNALRLYYQHIIPPHPDIIQIQQRLRECLVHLGNHSDEVPYDKNFCNVIQF